MAKITISNIGGQWASTEAINSRFQQIEDELNNKVLYRDNPIGETNAMQNNIDANNYKVVNVANGVSATDAVNVSQLGTYLSDVEAAASAAEGWRDQAEYYAGVCEILRDEAGASAASADTSEANAASYATNALNRSTDAGESAILAQKWASEAENVVVESGLYSAFHYAQKAAALVSSSRRYMGLYDASGGTLPIASPTTGDEGKYWVISVAGTLPTVGSVLAADELSINPSFAYEKFTPGTSYAPVAHTHGAGDIVSGTIATARLPAGTTSTVGAVQLSSSTSSTSTTLAATPSAVKAAYDLANQAASTTVAGRVELATNAETVTGTDTVRATTPAGVAAAIAAAPTGDSLGTKTLVWSGSATSVNKSSITGFTVGMYVVKFTLSGLSYYGEVYVHTTTLESNNVVRVAGGTTSYAYSVNFSGTSFYVITTAMTTIGSALSTITAIYKVG